MERVCVWCGGRMEKVCERVAGGRGREFVFGRGWGQAECKICCDHHARSRRHLIIALDSGPEKLKFVLRKSMQHLYLIQI